MINFWIRLDSDYMSRRNSVGQLSNKEVIGFIVDEKMLSNAINKFCSVEGGF